MLVFLLGCKGKRAPFAEFLIGDGGRDSSADPHPPTTWELVLYYMVLPSGHRSTGVHHPVERKARAAKRARAFGVYQSFSRNQATRKHRTKLRMGLDTAARSFLFVFATSTRRGQFLQIGAVLRSPAKRLTFSGSSGNLH